MPMKGRKGWLNRLVSDIIKDRWLYALLVPGIIFFIMFRYVPMAGLRIAFQEYNIFKPSASPWVGFEQFHKLFASPTFHTVFFNTLKISLLKLLFGFPMPILLALLLNEFAHVRYKKTIQTILYLPHFISWVILGGIIRTFLNPSSGLISQMVQAMGGARVEILASNAAFVPMLIITDVYKSMGWGTIIYFAAISGVSEDMYEAAHIDGATRFKQAIHITLPSIRPTIIIVFLLSLSNILNAGFDQIMMLYSPLVYSVSDVIDTYVYRKGIIEASYSFSAAAGLFKSVIAMTLVVGSNYFIRLFGERGIW